MMWRRDLRKRITGTLICLTGLFIISSSVLAAEPHEDPERANPVFSGISLLKYYSDSLDFVLRKDPAEVEARLEKMPFANIPQSLEEATDSFAASGIGISHLVVAIDEDLVKLRALWEQCSLDEVVELAAQTSDNLSQANRELKHIEQATETTGEELRVSSAPEGSDLRRCYDEVLERIDRVRQMLDLYQDILTDLVCAPELLSPTKVTLKIYPLVAFVGDSIHFWGILTAEEQSLAGREVDILVNSSQYVTVKTDAYGQYQGRLRVPFWYIPELDLQALYCPRDEDIDLYVSSTSPTIKVKALFYETVLDVTLEDKAYPGLETTVSGRFDYGQSSLGRSRKFEIYLDNVLATEGMAQEAFAQRVKIDPVADVGQHLITVSAEAVGRYAPVAVSVLLNVTKATPILDLNTPTVAMIPGSFGLGGKLYSEVGPLSEASIKMELGKSQIELVSSEDGAFDTRITVGMGFGVVGSQDLVILALPQEPWHTSQIITRSVTMANMVNCGGILAILIFLGIYLPSRLRKRLGAYPRRRVRPEETITWPELAPTYSDSVIIPVPTKENGQGGGEPRNRVFYWYRLVVRLILGITKALSKPHQTLREFARESDKVLGPAAKYFIELTKMVEKLLYSPYRPTEEDVGKSQQLSHTVEEGLKGEGV